MALKHSKFTYLHMKVDGTLSTGDGQDWSVFPYTRGRLDAIMFAVVSNGATSGSTDIMIARVRDGSAADLLSAASSMANDSSTNSQWATASTLQNRDIQFGDMFRVDIDAVPGTASTDLAVVVKVKIVADTE